MAAVRVLVCSLYKYTTIQRGTPTEVPTPSCPFILSRELVTDPCLLTSKYVFLFALRQQGVITVIDEYNKPTLLHLTPQFSGVTSLANNQ